MHARTRLAVALLALALAPAAWASDAATSADRLGDAVASLLPLGTIFDRVAANDPKWPLQERPDAVDATQLACMRAELSTDGYRRAKRREAREYIARNASRVESDIAAVRSAAPLFSRLVLAGAEEGGPSRTADDVLRDATGEEVLAFMTVISDPSMAALRELIGLGNAFDLQKSEQENEEAGKQAGSSLAIQTIMKASITCKVPPGAFL